MDNKPYDLDNLRRTYAPSLLYDVFYTGKADTPFELQKNDHGPLVSDDDAAICFVRDLEQDQMGTHTILCALRLLGLEELAAQLTLKKRDGRVVADAVWHIVDSYDLAKGEDYVGEG